MGNLRSQHTTTLSNLTFMMAHYYRSFPLKLEHMTWNLTLILNNTNLEYNLPLKTGLQGEDTPPNFVVLPPPAETQMLVMPLQ